MILEKFVAIVSALDAQTIMAITAITAIVSIFIAVVALSFSIWQGMQNRKHNRLSMYPYLVIEGIRDRNNNEAIVGFTIKNEGIGLAFIKEFVLYYNGKEISRNNGDNYRKFLFGDIVKSEGYKPTKTSHLGFDTLMKVGEERTLWLAEYNPEETDGSIISRLDFYIKYHSIYGKQDKTFIRDSRGHKKLHAQPIVK